AQPRRCQATPHRRHGVVDEEVSEHRVAEGPADERCHHRVSQGRVPLSQTESAKDSGHYQHVPPSRSWISAGRIMECSSKPIVSTRIWRFFPLTFLPAS